MSSALQKRGLSLLIFGLCCFGPQDAHAQAGIDVSGSYSGTWVGAGNGGVLTVNLDQDGSEVVGTLLFSELPCFGVATLVGTVDGFNFAATFGSTSTEDNGSFSLSSTGSQLTGPFRVIDGCSSGLSGAMTLIPNGPAVIPTLALTATPTATVTPTPIPPAGDCNLDGSVTVDEIVTIISIALNSRSLDLCPVTDLNFDGAITVDEIVRSVFHALDGIGGPVLPPPIPEPCTVKDTACICREDICCPIEGCGLGDHCGETFDCRVGLVCAEAIPGELRCLPSDNFPPPL